MCQLKVQNSPISREPNRGHMNVFNPNLKVSDVVRDIGVKFSNLEIENDDSMSKDAKMPKDFKKTQNETQKTQLATTLESAEIMDRNTQVSVLKSNFSSGGVPQMAALSPEHPPSPPSGLK